MNAEPEGQRKACKDQRGQNDLSASRPDDRAAQAPEQSWAKLKSDQEQHHHHAKFRDVHHAASTVANQAQQVRTDDHSGQEIAKDRTQAQLLGNRHRGNRGQ